MFYWKLPVWIYLSTSVPSLDRYLKKYFWLGLELMILYFRILWLKLKFIHWNITWPIYNWWYCYYNFNQCEYIWNCWFRGRFISGTKTFWPLYFKARYIWKKNILSWDISARDVWSWWHFSQSDVSAKYSIRVMFQLKTFAQKSFLISWKNWIGREKRINSRFGWKFFGQNIYF